MFRPYNAKVLVGNWYEDRVLDQVNYSLAQFSPSSLSK
jgi:hypothetical protein